MKTKEEVERKVCEEEKRFSIDKCKRVLNRNGNNYNDEQVRQIRDFLYFIAEMEYENFLNAVNHEKQSNPLHPCLHR
jgi:hypothetical protein